MTTINVNLDDLLSWRLVAFLVIAIWAWQAAAALGRLAARKMWEAFKRRRIPHKPKDSPQ